MQIFAVVVSFNFSLRRTFFPAQPLWQLQPRRHRKHSHCKRFAAPIMFLPRSRLSCGFVCLYLMVECLDIRSSQVGQPPYTTIKKPVWHILRMASLPCVPELLDARGSLAVRLNEALQPQACMLDYSSMYGVRQLSTS